MSSSKLASISLPAGISSQIFMFFFHQTFLWSHWQRSWSQLAGRESRFHLKVGRPGPGLHSKLGLHSHFSNTTPCKIRLTKKYIWFRVPCCQSPPPHGMGPKPTFWLQFHGTRQNTWYLQWFDKLGLRNRGKYYIVYYYSYSSTTTTTSTTTKYYYYYYY